jgi:hypothetical protein
LLIDRLDRECPVVEVGHHAGLVPLGVLHVHGAIGDFGVLFTPALLDVALQKSQRLGKFLAHDLQFRADILGVRGDRLRDRLLIDGLSVVDALRVGRDHFGRRAALAQARQDHQGDLYSASMQLEPLLTQTVCLIRRFKCSGEKKPKHHGEKSFFCASRCTHPPAARVLHNSMILVGNHNID